MQRRSRIGAWWVYTILLPLPAVAAAALTLIYDSGLTQPLAPYLEVFETDDASVAQPPTTNRSLIGAADPEMLLPIRSPGMMPGPVEARAQSRPFARPFFLIGSDAQSRYWLATHRDRLKAVGAVGMLVQADTRADLHDIAVLAEGLSILPASGSDIAQALGIIHYPVLITAHGIEQ